jgi:hypothetical protein
MADTALSALTEATAIDGDDLLYVVEDGNSRKVTVDAVAAYIASTVTAAEVTIADSNSAFAGNSVEEALEQLAASVGGAVTASQVTIADSDSAFAGSTVEEALEQLAGSVGGAVSAASVTVNDSGSYFAGSNVEDALDEVGAALSGFSAQQYAVDGTPASDDLWHGRAITGVNAGATIAQWEAVLMGSGGEWLLADATDDTLAPCRGLAAAAGTDNNPMTVVTEGVIRNDAWSWATLGAAIYLSTTAGGLTQTAPSATGEIVQPVGFAITADVMYLCIGAATFVEVA